MPIYIFYNKDSKSIAYICNFQRGKTVYHARQAMEIKETSRYIIDKSNNQVRCQRKAPTVNASPRQILDAEIEFMGTARDKKTRYATQYVILRLICNIITRCMVS